MTKNKQYEKELKLLERYFNKCRERLEELDNEEGMESLDFDIMEDLLLPFLIEYKKQIRKEIFDKFDKYVCIKDDAWYKEFKLKLEEAKEFSKGEKE